MSLAVVNDLAAKNPAFRKIAESWKPFRGEEGMWFQVAETGFANLFTPQARAAQPPR